MKNLLKNLKVSQRCAECKKLLKQGFCIAQVPNDFSQSQLTDQVKTSLQKVNCKKHAFANVLVSYSYYHEVQL